MNTIKVEVKEIPLYQIDKALDCLVDNGIDPDDAEIVLQALGYILIDTELFPDQPNNGNQKIT